MHDSDTGHVRVFNPYGKFISICVHDGVHYDPVVIRGESWEIRRFPINSINMKATTVQNTSNRCLIDELHGNVIHPSNLSGEVADVCLWALMVAVCRRKKRESKRHQVHNDSQSELNAKHNDSQSELNAKHNDSQSELNAKHMERNLAYCPIDGLPSQTEKEINEHVNERVHSCADANANVCNNKDITEFNDPVPLNELQMWVGNADKSSMILNNLPPSMDSSKLPNISMNQLVNKNWDDVIMARSSTTVRKLYEISSETFELQYEIDHTGSVRNERLYKIHENGQRQYVIDATIATRLGTISDKQFFQAMVVPIDHTIKDIDENWSMCLATSDKCQHSI